MHISRAASNPSNGRVRVGVLTNNVEDTVDGTNVGQEGVTHAKTLRCTLDQTGNIDNLRQY